jgi:hypothetical protein
MGNEMLPLNYFMTTAGSSSSYGRGLHPQFSCKKCIWNRKVEGSPTQQGRREFPLSNVAIIAAIDIVL